MVYYSVYIVRKFETTKVVVGLNHVHYNSHIEDDIQTRQCHVRKPTPINDINLVVDGNVLVENEFTYSFFLLFQEYHPEV